MFCKQRIWMMNGSLFPDTTFSPKPFSLKCPSIWLLKVNFYLLLNYFLPLSTLVPSLIYTGHASTTAPECVSQPWALDAQPGQWWQHMRVRKGSASSSWAWAALERKAGFGGRQGNVENSSRSCKLSHRRWLIPLSLGKGRDDTAFCLGWQQRQTVSLPQHMVWSVTIYIHFYAIIFSGTCVGFKKRQKNMQVLWIASKLKW